MTAQEFTDWQARMGWGQVHTARELDVDRKSVYNWRSGNNPIPRVVELACLYLEHVGDSNEP